MKENLLINKNLSELKKYIQKYIEDNQYNNIVAIYAMGSSVKKDDFDDFDINVFVKDDSYKEIIELEKMKQFLEENLKKRIDYNIIGMECVEDNIYNTDLFLHNNRHSLLLYEITTLKNLIYGKDILSNYKIKYYDLILETLKLTMVQVHRLNKEYLAKNKNDSYKNARKYLKYSIEFAMIFSGKRNPYINLKVEEVINKYPNIKKYSKEIDHAINGREVNLENAYNCMVELSKEMLRRFKYLVNYIYYNKEMNLNSLLNKKYFSFKTKKELLEFKKMYLAKEEYRRLIFKNKN